MLKENLAPEHRIRAVITKYSYHLVRMAKTNKIVRKILEHIAVHIGTIDIRQRV